jgi:hypothetical protein
MKIKMWCLINKNTNKVIKILTPSDISYSEFSVIGFATKEDLLKVITNVEDDEEIRKIEIEI